MLSNIRDPLVWSFTGKTFDADVESAVREIASTLIGSNSRIIVVTGTHGIISSGMIGPQHLKFAENDYRALKNIVNASGKPVHIQIYPINPVEPKSPTAKETESQSPFRAFGVKTEVWQSMTEGQRTKLVTRFAEHSVMKARKALEDTGNPENSAILLAYCGSFQKPNLR